MSEQKQNHDDCNCDMNVEMLQAVLDGEATQEEASQLKEHIDHCFPCLEHHDLEMAIKTLLQKNLDKVCCPEEDIQKIKNSLKDSH